MDPSFCNGSIMCGLCIEYKRSLCLFLDQRHGHFLYEDVINEPLKF